MPRRRATRGLSLDMIKLAQVLGQAWSAADTIQRRYPRVFAACVANALELDSEAAISFIDVMEREHVGIQAAKCTPRFRR